MRPTRILKLAVILLGIAGRFIDGGPLRAQDPVRSTKPRAPGPRAEPIIQRYDLTITPVAPPTPLLKYELLPPMRDRKPGNRAPYYLRAIIHWDDSLEEDVKERFKKMTMRNDMFSVDEFPADEVRELLPAFEPVLRQLERAAMRDSCNWNLDLQYLEGWDAISVSLGEFQRARDLARLLLMKARLEVAERRFDDALATLQVGYQLARDVAEPPTLINSLVGIAITTILNTVVRDWIDQPDSPNLYWALATRPRPFISVRRQFHFEAAFHERMFPVLRDPESAIRSADEWDRLIRQLVVDLEHLDTYWNEGRVAPTAANLEAVNGIIADALPIARRELRAAGLDRETLDSMPDGQILAIHTARFTRERFDQYVALLDVPPPHLDRVVAALTEETERIRASTTTADRRESLPVFDRLKPSLRQGLVAWMRPQQRLAGLQCVEAIRSYAAAHDGELPDSLDDIVDTPCPVNIHTGRPFEYQREGDHAVLTIPLFATRAPQITQEYTLRIDR